MFPEFYPKSSYHDSLAACATPAAIRIFLTLPDRLEFLIFDADVEHYEQIRTSIFRLKNLKEIRILGRFPPSAEFLYKWAIKIFEGISTLKRILIVRRVDGKRVTEYDFEREKCGKEISFKLEDHKPRNLR